MQATPEEDPASGDATDSTVLPRRYALLVVGLAVAIFSGLPFRVGDLYPLCRYAMFSHFDNVQSRQVLRDASGALHNVDEFSRIDCRAPAPPLAVAACEAVHRTDDYYERRDTFALEERRGTVARGTDLLLLRWTVSFPERYGPLKTETCTLAQCRAEK